MKRLTENERGSVLINALVIMALLSLAVVALQARSLADVARAQVLSDATQAALYLDSANALAALALQLDQELTETDHLAEDWARQDIVVPIDRGIIAVRLTDLQGRFNLNTLALPNDPNGDRAAFVRLAESVEIRKQSADRTLAYISRNAPLRTMDKLLGILDAAEFKDLAPLLTLLKGNPSLNVNTAPEPVLAAVLPQLTPEALNEIIGERNTTPFETPELFLERLGQAMTPEQLAEIKTGRFGVRTDFFAVRATVTLGQSTWSRETWLERSADDDKVRRIYQASTYQ